MAPGRRIAHSELAGVGAGIAVIVAGGLASRCSRALGAGRTAAAAGAEPAELDELASPRDANGRVFLLSSAVRVCCGVLRCMHAQVRQVRGGSTWHGEEFGYMGIKLLLRLHHPSRVASSLLGLAGEASRPAPLEPHFGTTLPAGCSGARVDGCLLRAGRLRSALYYGSHLRRALAVMSAAGTWAPRLPHSSQRKQPWAARLAPAPAVVGMPVHVYTWTAPAGPTGRGCSIRQLLHKAVEDLCN